MAIKTFIDVAWKITDSGNIAQATYEAIYLDVEDLKEGFFLDDLKPIVVKGTGPDAKEMILNISNALWFIPYYKEVEDQKEIDEKLMKNVIDQIKVEAEE